MVIGIWIGLLLSSLGIILLTVFGLIWISPGSKFHDWGFRIGLFLFVAGMGLTIATS